MEQETDILILENDNCESAVDQYAFQFFSSDDIAQMLWEFEETFKSKNVTWSDYVYGIVAKNDANILKAMLRRMKVFTLKPIGTIRVLQQVLLSRISLLFGLCSSSSSQIISAFFGNSLSRIPSL